MNFLYNEYNLTKLIDNIVRFLLTFKIALTGRKN